MVTDGLFGPLRFGQTRATIATLLGPPDDVGSTSRKYRRPTIWKYGDFEIYFLPAEDALTAISTDTFAIPQGDPSINLDPWQLRCGVPPQEIEDGLTITGITYRIAVPSHLAGTTQIITSSGVCLSFTDEPGYTVEMGGLYAMGHSIRMIGA